LSHRPSLTKPVGFCLLSTLLLAFLTPAKLGASPSAPASNDERLANQPLAVYKARRDRLLSEIKDGIIVLVGAREEDFGEAGRFRQYNDFMYLTGVETPAAYLLLIPAGLIDGRPASESLYIPQRNLAAERWTGVQIGPGAEAEKKFGIREAVSSQGFINKVRDILNAPPFKLDPDKPTAQARLYTIVPSPSIAPITRENQFIETVKRLVPHVKIQDLKPIVHGMRVKKSDSEIALLQKAIDITVEGQQEIARAIRPGVFEYQAQAALEAAFTRNGAERPGFGSIVGSGIYSTILHYQHNKKKIEADEVVVVDVGAEYSYYTADVTRTYPANGQFSERQREIYRLVLDAQRAAERAFRPGVSTFSDLQRAAIAVMRASPVRDRQGNTLDRYFIHGIGHYLGMDVHDVGNPHSAIPVGSVFTIEPGIYIQEEKLGIRIEDDYLVTETGLVKMSGKSPSEPDQIERLMAQRKADK
jgi:Xaa-Pro aminopeptidase